MEGCYQGSPGCYQSFTLWKIILTRNARSLILAAFRSVFLPWPNGPSRACTLTVAAGPPPPAASATPWNSSSRVCRGRGFTLQPRLSRRDGAACSPICAAWPAPGRSAPSPPSWWQRAPGPAGGRSACTNTSRDADLPTIVVIKDLDENPGFGAFFLRGEGAAATSRRRGSAASAATMSGLLSATLTCWGPGLPDDRQDG